METQHAWIDPAKFEKIAFILKSIAHPLRISVVELLGQYSQLSVGELEKLLDIEQPLLSHHLNILKLKGILENRREGKKIYYSLRMPEVLGVLKCMNQCDVEI